MSLKDVLTKIPTGFATVLGTLKQKPVTIEYPEQQKPMTARFRGRHQLKRYDDGLERCIGCALCAAACPADAIYVEAAENTNQARFSPGERYAKTYEINMLRCIFCGLCEEACPKDAIYLTETFAPANYTRQSFVYGKPDLLIPNPVNDPQGFAAAQGKIEAHKENQRNVKNA